MINKIAEQQVLKKLRTSLKSEIQRTSQHGETLMSPKPDDRSEINPEGGFRFIAPNKTTINPPYLSPAKDNRFNLSQPLVAKIEAIARARVKVVRYLDLKPETEVSIWESEEHQTVLAMSVNASSEIEGEEVHADLIPLILNESTKPESGAPITPELSHRLEVVRQIYKTYLWALKSDKKELVSSDFILEVHRRMFGGSDHYSKFAGSFKTQEVVVAGSRYHVETLPAAKVKEAIDSLCARTNRDFGRNRSSKDKPLLTIIAEFIIDFLAIHPFQDGNGRTARLLSTYLLDRIGYHFSSVYPIDSIINERRAEYFQALFSGQRNWYTEHEDLTEWVDFYIDAVFEQWERAHSKIRRAEAKQRSQSTPPI